RRFRTTPRRLLFRAQSFGRTRHMAYKTLDIRKDGAVDWVTLNRPDSLNALNPQLVDDLLDYFQSMYFERKTRIIVLKGAGRAFSAGLDLKEREAPDNEPGGGPQRGLL